MSSYWTKRRKLSAAVDRKQSALQQERLKNLNNYFSAGTTEDTRSTSVDFDSASCVLISQRDSSKEYNVDFSSSEINEDQEFQTEDLLDDLPIEFDSNTFELEAEKIKESSDFECEMESVPSHANLSIQLAEWAASFSITNQSLAALLTTLRHWHPELPKDPRTLLRTVSSEEISSKTLQVSGGSYYHFGIGMGIKKALDSCDSKCKSGVQKLSIQISVDGVPVFKRADGEFWPIQGLVDKPFRSTPFLIGLYYGRKKTTSLDFFDSFVQEHEYLKQTGIDYEGSNIGFEISIFVCDAPASLEQ